ncbi:MAG TPA: L-arabinose isomerase [Clostridia bacterium]|nr:L-arabinose isomerase [Clostridia bacterium]
MDKFKNYQVWFFTGSQKLYGKEVLKQVKENSKKIVKGLNENSEIPIEIKFKSVLTSSDKIKKAFLEANSNESCIGLITWMHTFSPAKMWINGLKILNKPLVHLHTQYNKKIPWADIDMNFMNTNQSAHGGREYGHIVSRLKLKRKIIVGHWQDKEVIEELKIWTRVAAAWNDSQGAKFARFGDNMKDVAVTEGDKVEAEIKFGYSVNGYGIGELVKYVKDVNPKNVDKEYINLKDKYKIKQKLNKKTIQAIKNSVQIELGIRAFLEDGNFKGFTTNFETLHGLKQLPGLAVQRLMKDGYGFGAEGDWKTAALVRAMKVMSEGLEGGTSFMEHYTYHFEEGNMQVLGAHMLEVCETIAANTPSLEVHPLSIGNKDDPARLVFDSKAGSAINASIVDMGDRFRMLVNNVKAIKPDKSLPKLPVARVIWKPKPDLKTAVKAWIYGGGAHHTGFSLAVDGRYMKEFAEIADIEYLQIDENTVFDEFKENLKLNDIYYKINN